MMTRREWMRVALGGAAVALVAPRAWSEGGEAPGEAAPTPITVYLSPTCGCCAKWLEHLRANDFRVTRRDTEDMNAVKKTLGIPEALTSCHTAVVGSYVVEGHVPADLIRRMLKERPKAKGLAVPGMPMGSPGMEGPRKDAYDVLLFEQTGRTRVYAKR